MTTAVDYKFNEEERQFLSELILYAFGKIDRRVQQGEKAPMYADRRSLAKMYLDLQDKEVIRLDDSQQIALSRLMSLFRCEYDSIQHLISGGWAFNENFGCSLILSRYKKSHIRRLKRKLYSGKPYITSMILFGKDE